MARKAKNTWRFVTAAPVREVFAVTEQMVGIPPYRFEPTGHDSAQVIEAERKHWLFGMFTKRFRNPRWIRVTAREIEAGTEVVVTSTASWAGMEYAIYVEPRYDAPRGEAVHTASKIEATGMHGMTWVKVRLESGAEGYIERDQVVPAPPEASRTAQVRTAALG